MTATLHSTDSANDRCPACGKRLADVSAPATPPGWRLVPEEPTQEMLDEVCSTETRYPTIVADDATMTEIYRFMLSAAPPSPRVPSEEQIARLIFDHAVGLRQWDNEFYAGERAGCLHTAAAILALFTPHQGEGK